MFNHVYTSDIISAMYFFIKLIRTSLIITCHHFEVGRPDGSIHPTMLRKHLSGLVALLTLRTAESTFTASCQCLCGEWRGYPLVMSK